MSDLTAGGAPVPLETSHGPLWTMENAVDIRHHEAHADAVFRTTQPLPDY
jgi:hypothetical protein